MDKEENMFDENYLERVESINQPAKIQQETLTEQQVKQIVDSLIEENERLLIEINSLAEYRKNKNVITPQMSLLTNKLQRNLIRIARLVPPSTLADPQHVKEEKERFLKFYRGRNAPKKNGPSQQPINGAISTPTKTVNITKEVKKE